jgi:hypothetical protein
VALLHMAGLENSECIQKIYAPSSSLLQGKHLPLSPSPLRLNIFRLFVILSLTQLYYTYRAPLRPIGQENSANVAWSTFQSLKRIHPRKRRGHTFFE